MEREHGRLHVAEVRVAYYSGSLTRPFVTARRRVEAVSGVVVEVELTDGTVGLGSAAETWAVTGESSGSLSAAVGGPLRDSLIGQRRSVREHAAALAGACEGNASAKAAVDIALHDAWARWLGVPLATALGGDTAVRLRTDMTVSLEEPSVMADRAREAVDAGYRVLKIKLGHDVEADLARLRAVAEAAPGVGLRLDANQGWTPKEAVRVIHRIEESNLPVEFIEQPVAKADVRGLAEVTAAVGLPVMADEAVASPADVLRLVENRAVDLINIKLAKCGGIRQALAIADVAATAGIPCMMGAMMEPRISIAAAAHVAAAHPNITLVDLDSAEWIDDARWRGGYEIAGGELTLLDTTGLGIRRGLRPMEEAS